MLNTGRPKEILYWFKNTDVDPRELLLLFKDLTVTSQVLIQDHVKTLPLNYLCDTYRKTHAQQDLNFNLDQKHHEAKEAVKGLLEFPNAKYLADLRKDEDKKAEFMYSSFS